MIQALQFWLSLVLLIVIHEFGHFFWAKLFGVRVSQFYLFFNPGFTLFRAKKIEGKWQFRFFEKGRNKGDETKDEWDSFPETTEWGIGWLPLGGYCSVEGMIDERTFIDGLPSEPQTWEYRSKKLWQRMLIISGGVINNLVFALLIFGSVLFVWGKDYYLMSDFKNGFEFNRVAENTGFKDGDIPLMANGELLKKFDETSLRQILDAKNVSVIRDGDTITFNIKDSFAEEVLSSSRNSKELLISPILPFVVADFTESSVAKKAGLQIGDSIVSINQCQTSTFSALSKEVQKSAGQEISVLICRDKNFHTIKMTPDSTGKIGVYPYSYGRYYKHHHDEYSVLAAIPAGISLGFERLVGYVSDFKYLFVEDGFKNLGGFKSIGSMYSPVWNWHHFWDFTAFLSLILFFMNFLPIPALDGGYFFFLLIELFTGKKPSDELLAKINMIGMILLFFLFIFSNVNDFIR